MAWIEQVLRLAELAPESRSLVLDQAGALAFTEGNSASARRYFEASVDLRRRSDSKRTLALSLTHLAAIVRWGCCDARAAVALYEESLTLAREIGNRLLMGAALMPLGTLALDRGVLEEAQALLRSGLAMYIEVELEVALPLALEQFAALAAAQDYPVRALRLAGAGAAWRHKLNTYPTPYRAWMDRYLSTARMRLDEREAAGAWRDGEGMSLEQAITYALERPMKNVWGSERS